MFDWYPQTPSDFMLLYSAVLALAVIFFFRGRGKHGSRMRLRLRGEKRPAPPPPLEGATPPVATDRFSHIQPAGERPLNVMFMYNGENWDAYEVLGLPAGSNMDKVSEAFSASMKSVDRGSQAFLEAAYRAIRTEWDSYKKTGS